MSRFNQSTQGTNITTNFEGEKAYKLTQEMELYTMVCTFALQNKFYESDKDQMERLRALVYHCDPLFVAKLAVYAREEMYLRTVPIVLAVELAKVHKGDNLVSRLITRIVQRADEMTEVLSYYQVANNRDGEKKLNKISNQIKKGLREIFETNKFSEYHYGKYNRKTDVRFRDVLFLTHPKAFDKKSKDLFDKIANDTLDTPMTWEVTMSEAGKADTEGTTKTQVWENMIDSNKMGYMAILRNLRNMLIHEVSLDRILKVCEILSDPEQVARSKQFPFRFLSAYRMLTGGIPNQWDDDYNEKVNSPYLPQVLKALEGAMKASVVNLPDFKDEQLLIATDVSGSMQHPVSPKSVVTSYDIGTVLTMMLGERCESCITGMFGDNWKQLDFPTDNILQNANDIWKREGEVGYATHFYKVLQWANSNKYHFDHIMVFTDCQVYGGDTQKAWSLYRKNVNPNAKIYLFDLNGYGQSPLNILDDGVYLIAGWSDRIFETLSKLDQGGETLDVVKSINF